MRDERKLRSLTACRAKPYRSHCQHTIRCAQTSTVLYPCLCPFRPADQYWPTLHLLHALLVGYAQKALCQVGHVQLQHLFDGRREESMLMEQMSTEWGAPGSQCGALERASRESTALPEQNGWCCRRDGSRGLRERGGGVAWAAPPSALRCCAAPTETSPSPGPRRPLHPTRGNRCG